MRQKKLNSLDLLLATDIAYELMPKVEGVVKVHVEPRKLDIEPLLNGNGFVSANVNRDFVDQNIDKSSPTFVRGSPLYDTYETYVSQHNDGEVLDRVFWQIEFQKVGGFFSSFFVGVSFLAMGEQKWQVGYVGRAKDIPTVFSGLCCQANTNQKITKQTIAAEPDPNDQPAKYKIWIAIGVGVIALMQGLVATLVYLTLIGLCVMAWKVFKRNKTAVLGSNANLPSENQEFGEVKSRKDFLSLNEAAETIRKAVKSAKEVRFSEQPAAIDEDSQACPICAETIKRAAKKCRYCGEWLDA